MDDDEPAWRYLISCSAPAAGLLAAVGALLWAALRWHWRIAGGGAGQQVIPLLAEAAAAAVSTVAACGPLRSTEQAATRWPPGLRVYAALALAAAAAGAPAAGATGGRLPGGTLAMIRNFGGMAGIGLLSAAALGAAFGWAGPAARLLITEGAPAGSRTAPPAWPARSAQTIRLEIRAKTPVTLRTLTVGLQPVGLAGDRGSFEITAQARREADGYGWDLLVVPGGWPEHPVS
jgi:hypothetical protein